MLALWYARSTFLNLYLNYTSNLRVLLTAASGTLCTCAQLREARPLLAGVFGDDGAMGSALSQALWQQPSSSLAHVVTEHELTTTSSSCAAGVTAARATGARARKYAG